MRFCGTEPKADSHRARSSVESIRAQNEGAFETIEPQSGDKYHRRELHFSPCGWQQFLKVEKWADDRYGLVGSVSVTRVGMTGDDGQTRFSLAFCELRSRARVHG